jgi:HEAT repeat protein
MIEEKDDEQVVIAELEADGLSNKQRRALLSKLRQVSTERSIDVLRANLCSKDVKSQVRAVFALAHIGTEQAADALIDSLAQVDLV